MPDEPTKLDYATRLLKHRPNTGIAMALGVIVGFLVTPPALFLVFSAGADHGGFALARALFPMPILVFAMTGPITFTIIAAVLMQFPLYGFVIGYSVWRRTEMWAVILAAIHLAAVMVCFSSLIPNI